MTIGHELSEIIFAFTDNMCEVANRMIQKSSLEIALNKQYKNREKSERHYEDFPDFAKEQRMNIETTENRIKAIDQELDKMKMGTCQLIGDMMDTVCRRRRRRVKVNRRLKRCRVRRSISMSKNEI